MSSTTATRIASDGTTLATRRWQTGSPRAAIVLVHGLAEHAGRYEHVGAGLANRGFDVRATDLRGFGASEGRRAHIDDFDTFVSDLAADIASAAELRTPTVLLGHSMGSLISMLYAASDEQQPDLLVLSAPPLAAKLPRLQVLAARLLSPVLPRLRVPNGLAGDQLSTDPSVGGRYFADPLVQTSSTLAFGRAGFAAMDRIRGLVDRITQPTLVIHGGDDSIVPPRVSAPFESRDGTTRIVFDGFRHESFNEDGGTLAIATVADWIDAQLAAT